MISDHLPLIIFIGALLIDILFGEFPNLLHPVVWMGNYIKLIWNKRFSRSKSFLFVYGLLLIISGVLVFSIIPYFILKSIPIIISTLLTIFMLTAVFSIKALILAAKEVQEALKNGDLKKARELTAWHLVSRDTSALNEEEIVSAVIESIAENITDSFSSPLFFFAFGGIPWAWAYRFTNTSDSMIAYRKGDFEWGGKITAWLDDIFNWIPARITGIFIIISSIILKEDWRNGFKIMVKQHGNTASPNAGWTMSAMAGSLDITLEKKGDYLLDGGSLKKDYHLIDRAIKIVITTMVLMIVLNLFLLEAFN